MKFYLNLLPFLTVLTVQVKGDAVLTELEKPLNVLVTAPSIAYSHVAFQLQLAEILAQRGHVVTLAIHEMRPIPRLTSKHGVEILEIHTSVAGHERTSQHSLFDQIFRNGSGLDSKAMKAFAKSFTTVCKEVLRDEQYFSVLKSKQFDVAIAEEYDLCSLPLFQKLGIEAVVMTTPTTMADLTEHTLGIPIPRSYNTFGFYGAVNSPKLTFFQRLSNVLTEFENNFWGGFYVYEDIQKMLDAEHGRGTFDLKQLLRDVDIYITNAHDLIDLTRPTTAKMVNVGTLAVRKPKQLDPEIELIFNRSKKGIVLFSWGSQIDLFTLPLDLKLNLFNAFSQFPDFDFLLRYDKNRSSSHDLIDEYPNLHPFQWLDQTSILAHERTLAFITHGGRNSMSETLTYGVPTICVPLFADQQYNAGVYRHKKLGVALQLQDLTQQNVVHSLKKVLFDPEIRKNAHVLRDKIARYPYDPQREFINWVEYVAEFKQFDELNLHGAEMDLVRHNNLDVYAFLLLGSFLILVLLKYLFQTVVVQIGLLVLDFVKKKTKTKVH